MCYQCCQRSMCALPPDIIEYEGRRVILPNDGTKFLHKNYVFSTIAYEFGSFKAFECIDG